MKKFILVLVGLIAILSCDNSKKSLDDSSLEIKKSEINLVIDAWHKSATDANFENYFKAMTPESIFIGTDASENWKYEEFKTFSKPYFDKGKAWSFTALERNVYINSTGDMGWFDELLDTHMGICRGSGVLINKNGDWKIEHYVLSLTIPNDNIDRIKEINKEMDAAFKSSLKK